MAVAVCIETPTKFARRTCAVGTAIPKGTIMAATTPNTVAACSADNDVFGGIAWMEKSDTTITTEITVALDGVWAILCSAGAITIGQNVVISGANLITVYATLDDEKGLVVGKAMEAGAGSTTIKVRVNCMI